MGGRTVNSVIVAYIHDRVMLAVSDAATCKSAAPPGGRPKILSPWRPAPGADRCRADAGGGGRARGHQRARGGAAGRRVAGRAVPAFREPRRADDGGRGGGAASCRERV